jgi:hypothetical protein
MNMLPTRTLTALTGLLCLAFSSANLGRCATAEDNETELVRKLASRIDQLEHEVKDLRASAAAPDATPPEETQPTYPRVHLNGFADFNYHSSNTPGTHSAFELGEFDLYVKAAISEKASFLAETVLAADGNNNWGLDVERILFEYKASPYFNLAAGRYHTAIGYYNNAFHHGTWFQTTTGRPSFLAFEDEGGLLPVHNIGLTANGEIPSGSLGLHYYAEIGNGRAYVAPTSANNPVQDAIDSNDHKAVNLALSARPERVPGLQFGTGYYADKLSPESQVKTNEGIWHSFVVYKDAQWEFLSEFYSVSHEPEGGATTHSTLWFAQLAHQFGPFRPYFRYTHTAVPAADAAFALLGASGERNGSAIGVRWDFETYAALKAQYDSVRIHGDQSQDDFTLQLALTF